MAVIFQPNERFNRDGRRFSKRYVARDEDLSPIGSRLSGVPHGEAASLETSGWYAKTLSAAATPKGGCVTAWRVNRIPVIVFEYDDSKIRPVGTD
jgi:hypothetical protein